MVARYAEADLAVDLEAARGRQEAEGGRAQRVLRGQHDAPVVDAAGVGRRRRRAAQREVPFEEVVFEGFGVEVGRGGRGELRGFFYCGGGGLGLDRWRVAEEVGRGGGLRMRFIVGDFVLNWPLVVMVVGVVEGMRGW